MAMWNPWRGCHKCSEGCEFCYIHKGDYKRDIDTNLIVKTKDFSKPVEKNKKDEYKVKSNQTVYLCFSTDFLVEDADIWRNECWEMIKERSDLSFLFLTKRIDRFKDCLPDDWNDGYDNVIVGCTVENQKNVDYKLDIFSKLPIKHKIIICQPLIEKVDISKYLGGIEEVVVGGEADKNARVLNYDWVLSIRDQCIKNNVNFEFRQCGTNFIKDSKEYTLATRDLMRMARKANINYISNND
jgi:Bacteriophage protein gp37